jgi:hypothetical protein
MLNKLKVMGVLPLLYPTGNLIRKSFHKGFHMCTDQRSFLRNFFINSELKIN